jgi:DNA polymerase V
MPKNSAYSPIDIPEGSELDIFGVVTHVIRNLRHK